MIYAFTGKKRSGKSTAAAYLAQKLPNAVRVNFKDALVEEIKQNFPDLIREITTIMDRTEYDGWGWTVDRLVDEKPPLFRTLLQNYGTDVRRKDNQNYWIQKWLHNVAGNCPKLSDFVCDPLIITDDVRFINEAKAVKNCGGVVIRIVRTDQIDQDTHSSETEMDRIETDYTIRVASGKHEKLYAELDAIVVPNESTAEQIRTYAN